MKTQLLNMARRNSLFLGIATGQLLNVLINRQRYHRNTNWPDSLQAIIVASLTIWGIQRLWASRKYRGTADLRIDDRSKMIAAIVVLGLCQIVASFYSEFKSLAIGNWIAPILMVGMAAILVSKGLKAGSQFDPD